MKRRFDRCLLIREVEAVSGCFVGSCGGEWRSRIGLFVGAVNTKATMVLLLRPACEEVAKS